MSTTTDRVTAFEHALEHAAHLLPAQGPIGIFIHHNTLHAFEDRPFERAVIEAAELYGTEPFMHEAEFRRAYARGRILERDLDAVLEHELGVAAREAVMGRATRLELRKFALQFVEDEPNSASLDWQLDEGQLFDDLGSPLDDQQKAELWAACERHFARSTASTPQPAPRFRDALRDAKRVDLDAFVNPTMIRLTAAFVDQGIAYWPMPHRELGLFEASTEILAQPGPPPNAWVRELTREMQKLRREKPSALKVALDVLDDLGIDDARLEPFVKATLLALPGWAGLELRPDRAPVHAPPARLVDFLALRLALEREAARFVLRDRTTPLGELWAAFVPQMAVSNVDRRPVLAAFAVLAHAGISASELDGQTAETRERFADELRAFGSLERRRVWHLAYERRHLHQVLDALAAYEPAPRVASPRFQAVFCIDERAESLRRHLEEVEPDVETFGTAGFFGVAMYYRGVDDAVSIPLCPIVITPAHEVREHALPGASKRLLQRRAQRRFAGRLVRSAEVGSRTLFRGTLWSAALGMLTAIPLVLRVLFPRPAAKLGRGFGELSLPSVETRLDLEAFSIEEMTSIVGELLENMGMTRVFSPLVVVVGHGSSSLNNPHESAHDCGACGGGRGGPNARAFAEMANRAAVRERLVERGIAIPSSTWFVGALYDTCNDSIAYFDEDLVPRALAPELDALKKSFDRARALDAHERCRRFENASLSLSPEQALRHVEARAEDLAQPRPEYGHATNAFAIVGRRERTRGLFLDRRAFLISYDPKSDPDARWLERLLAAVVPVGAGINLEYYFSYVDPVRFGSGTKLPHNITSLVGVMDGYASDLRTGLPWQMVEIHEPVRLLTVIEAKPESVLAAVSALPSVHRLVENGWLRVATLDPDSSELHVFEGGEFVRYLPEPYALPHVARSMDWYHGHRDHLGIARIQ